MYFKIKSNILFRQYDEYGYITDNSEFGYRMLDDSSKVVGDKYVSQSGAVILGALSKKPQHVDSIVKKLLDIFVDVEFAELKLDVVDFLLQLVDCGYLSYGETAEECNLDNTVRQECVRDGDVMKINDCSKEFTASSNSLRSVHIEIVSKCNERCVHCYIPHKYKVEEMDSALFYKIVEEARKLNVVNVTLSGGEPLLHKDILKFMAKCRELDFSVNVLTNLTLLTDDIITEMRRNPLLSVQTSLYSMEPCVHDSITGVSGSFIKTKEGLMKLLSVGVPLQISCPIMKQNKDSFTEVIKWGDNNNIGVSPDYVIFAAYDHSNDNLLNRLSLEEVGEAIDKQLSVEYVDAMRETASKKYLIPEDAPICSICKDNLCVSADGNVFPCVGWQENTLGNLKYQTIGDIWKFSEKIKFLRSIKRSMFPKCMSCEDRGYCNICMRCNDNENSDAFKVSDFYCKTASLIHNKMNSFSTI